MAYVSLNYEFKSLMEYVKPTGSVHCYYDDGMVECVFNQAEDEEKATQWMYINCPISFGSVTIYFDEETMSYAWFDEDKHIGKTGFVSSDEVENALDLM